MFPVFFRINLHNKFIMRYFDVSKQKDMTNLAKLKELKKIERSINKAIDQAQHLFDNDVSDLNCAIIDNLRSAKYRCLQGQESVKQKIVDSL